MSSDAFDSRREAETHDHSLNYIHHVGKFDIL